MIRKQDISCVIFDMDGLMFDTERLAIQVWQKAGRTYGFDIPESLIIECIGNNIQTSRAMLETALGKKFNFKQVRKLRIQYTNEYITKNGVPIKKGLYNVLNVLTKYSVLKAVATSTERNRAEAMLNVANILNNFDMIVCGDEIQRGKPEPDIFLSVAERLQITPEKCVVLEDSEPGILAASNAHMFPILVPDIKMPSEKTMKMVYRTFTDLDKVAEYFLNLFQSDN